MTLGVLILGHGSRDATANAEFEALVAAYRAMHPDREVAHGYVELAEPPLPVALQALARRCDHVVVLPLFLFAAGHVKNDLPLALHQARRDFPRVRFTAARSLGVHTSLVELALERVRGAIAGAQPSRKTAVIVVGRGASDPDANGDFCKVVRLLGEGNEFAWVLPSFIGITRPLFEDVAELVARARPDHIVVVPYFLFAGRLITKLRSQVEAFRTRYPWIRAELADHLGAAVGHGAAGLHDTGGVDDRLFALVDERLQEAVAGAQPLPCDTCHYRVPVSGVVENVGGLRAMLWSLRHGFTHTQAMPHAHAHKPLAKHVLVCANADCADRGSVPLLGALRRLIKEAGRDRDIRVTRTLCMGRCGEGPTVAVYPDGIWYRGVTEADAAELVEQHLLGDRLVSRLVDNIMQ
jgi:sirohydrochlorin ferrochelatase/(2Fe-2S) ferredoxin